MEIDKELPALKSDREIPEPANKALGRLRAEVAIEQARAAQLRAELARNELATAGAIDELRLATERATQLEAAVGLREAELSALRERVASLEKGVQEQRVVADARVREAEALSAKLSEVEQALAEREQMEAQEKLLREPPTPIASDPVGDRKPRQPLFRLPRWVQGTSPKPTKSITPSYIPSLSEQRTTIERSGMFDASWYQARYAEVLSSGLDPILHYLSHGSQEGKDPAPGFSTEFYLETNPDVRSSGLNPLYHYVVIGRHQGRPPSQDAKYVGSLDQATIIATEFDDVFYRLTYKLQMSPPQAVEHYLRKGWKEGRDPHPQFSTRYYLKENTDIWRAGINPYVHYLLSGRREGRLPRLFPGLKDELIDQWRTIAREFDARFYRSTYPDVVEGRFEPVLHYLLDGWKRGYDPHPEFSTAHYLDNNPDVRAVGINPFFHFLAEGRKEGRLRRSAGTWTPRAEVRRVVGLEFDEVFYSARNPDLRASAIEPLDHYLDYGWREGRDPNADFATAFYLGANPDVAAVGINPFYHYLVAGRTEGRDPMHPGGWRTTALQRLRPLDEQAKELRVSKRHPTSLEASAILSAMRGCGHNASDRLALALTHDDYKTSVGGVQLCLKLEEQQARERHATYLAVHPEVPIGTLSNEPISEHRLVLTCNGQHLGSASAEALLSALEDIARQSPRTDIIVHSLLGHSAEAVLHMYEALRPSRALMWLHDFFSICPSYTLLRNGISYCHAPNVESTSCGICVYGGERREHKRKIKALFSRIPFEMVAPSQFAADFWKEKSGLVAARVHVQEHCSLQRTRRSMAKPEGAVRVAFLGHSSPHKGWEMYVRLLREFAGDGRFEFHHLGAGPSCDKRVIFTPVSVLDDGPNAMIDALIGQQIEIVVLWSIWPETFSFTLHETICAGAQVLTCEESGNIARRVRELGCGSVLKNDDELLGAFRSNDVYEAAMNARARAGVLQRPEFSGMTLSVLDKDERR